MDINCHLLVTPSTPHSTITSSPNNEQEQGLEGDVGCVRVSSWGLHTILHPHSPHPTTQERGQGWMWVWVRMETCVETPEDQEMNRESFNVTGTPPVVFLCLLLLGSWWSSCLTVESPPHWSARQSRAVFKSK